MTTLLLRFPGRRYHATPWGHHVNEGLIEWPPSPWRLLRALLSVGFTTCGWREVPPEARTLVETLAPVLPRYHLPPAAGAHSRHYMPAPVKTTLVFDTWAQVDNGVWAVTWPIELPAGQRHLLSDLAVRLNYLGRSESWVEAYLADADPADDANCWPESCAAAPGSGWEQVPLLAPVSAPEYLAWRQSRVADALAHLPTLDATKKKQAKKDRAILQARAEVEAVYPADIVACLLTDTAFLRGHGWSQAPGSRRIFYWRRADALESGAPQAIPAAPRPAPVEAMLLSLASASGNDHALPPITRALPQGELLHRALVAQAGRSRRINCPVVTEKCTSGTSLKGHQHAHIIHLDLDGDGHLDHCLIWAPMGLDALAQQAIRAVRQTFTKGGVAPLRVAVAGCGSPADLIRLPGYMGAAVARLMLLARTWTSVTPFVAPRFIKRRGDNTLVGQVAAELASRGLPPARIVELDQRDPQWLRLRHSVRVRRRGPPPPVNCGHMLRLTFPEPVSGPIALGYASHFGLGLFAAVEG
jgi:CRISPR-associated protein Csb2